MGGLRSTLKHDYFDDDDDDDGEVDDYVRSYKMVRHHESTVNTE